MIKLTSFSDKMVGISFHGIIKFDNSIIFFFRLIHSKLGINSQKMVIELLCGRNICPTTFFAL